MIAPHHREVAVRVGELAFLDVLDPRFVHADRIVVLTLTGHRACVTADTPPVVDDKAIVRYGDHLRWFMATINVRQDNT